MKPSLYASAFSVPEIQEQLQLSRRFLPQDMNTGGFFVAAFEKVPDGSQTSPSSPGPIVREGLTQMSADFLDLEADQLEAVRSFYGISKEGLGDELFVRGKEQIKNVFLLSKEARRDRLRPIHLSSFSNPTEAGVHTIWF